MKQFAYIIAFLISVSGFSQAKLGMHSSYTITPSAATVQPVGIVYSNTISVKCFIQNKGNAVFNGIIMVMRAVKSGTIQSSAAPVYSTSLSINPNDTIAFTFIDSIVPPTYKQNGNGNTVVVWPVSSSAITIDSLFTVPVYVNNPTGIQELDKNQLFIYPNPVSTMLFIKPQTGVEYKSITVYDVSMKLVSESVFTEQTDTHNLPPGVYTIIVTDSKGTRYSSRFTKTD